MDHNFQCSSFLDIEELNPFKNLKLLCIFRQDLFQRYYIVLKRPIQRLKVYTSQRFDVSLFPKLHHNICIKSVVSKIDLVQKLTLIEVLAFLKEQVVTFNLLIYKYDCIITLYDRVFILTKAVIEKCLKFPSRKWPFYTCLKVQDKESVVLQ